MKLTLLLLSLFGVLIGFLVWRRVPRRVLFQILHFSVWIYALSFFLSLQIVDKAAPRLTDGFVPYLLPVLPVVLFVAWAMHRQKSVQK
jgi:uncharacterized membrane protein YfcA